ncbi:MAG TPA: hypothetical protein VFC39_12020 [Acidobacteriaceae bacterium]|nr:hypothetical protein [Acidobacteriaceae bacterium]
MNKIPDSNTNARAAVVNRTHRVIREQALDMRARQERKRSLWVPLAIFSVLLPVICYAFWAMLDGYDLTPNGIPDASDQLVVMMMWFIPVTALVLGTVWLRRSRLNGHEVQR